MAINGKKDQDVFMKRMWSKQMKIFMLNMVNKTDEVVLVLVLLQYLSENNPL